LEMETISGIIGIACLGFAAIATFLLIPDRELRPRERIGIHTIFWTFIVYAMWIIYSTIWREQSWNSLDRYFYLSIPFLLGLILSLLAELSSKQPPFNINDARVKKIATVAWRKLPNNVRRGLQKTVMNVQAIPEWSDLDRESLKPTEVSTAKWYPILPFPPRGVIHISLADCKDQTDEAIMCNLAREFALAYQSTRTPFDTDAIGRAGDQLPVKWGFAKELTARQIQR
jgi:hypothetical protein